MLREQAGITQIQKLYLQMLFRCNFNCIHCFQGEKLKRDDRFSLKEAQVAIMLLSNEYGLKSVTLLGGEPFIHPDLAALLKFCKAQGLETVVCSNGYKIGKSLVRVANDLDHLRISVDGIESTHDSIRRPGSFRALLKTFDLANGLGIRLSATMTITSRNVREVAELALILQRYGILELKLHQLRLVGNAALHPELLCKDEDLKVLAYEVARIQEKTNLTILLDDDLDPNGTIIPAGAGPESFELDRIEVQPDGAIYISCKAVGNDSNAFWLKKQSGEILYLPNDADELSTGMPQVRYAKM